MRRELAQVGLLLGRPIAILVAILVATTGVALADELSSADKLRVIWSNQFAWTPAGIPIVTVGLASGREQVIITAGPPAGSATPAATGGGEVRVLPDGEGGPELRAGSRWTVRAVGAQRARIRYEVVVARGRMAESTALGEQMALWRKRGYTPSLVELGTVFGLRGLVIDMRTLVLTVSPVAPLTPAAEPAHARKVKPPSSSPSTPTATGAPPDEQARAREEADRIARTWHVETSLHPVVVTRPHGLIEARDERGTVVRNDDVLWFASGDAQGTLGLVDAVATATGPARDRRYAGKLYVTLGSDGKLAVANAVPEDRLLAGLLPAEIGAGAPTEALKAQAVAARNELFAKIGTRHLTDPYRLCSSVHCQVYAGAGTEDARATAAVSATRGELLVRDSDARLVDAVYSASCGGHTEDNDRAWGATPDAALRGVLDAGAADARTLARFDSLADEKLLREFLGARDEAGAAPPALPATPSCDGARGGSAFRWSTRVPVATVEANAALGRLRDVNVLERGVSGRVIRVEILGDRGRREVRGELEVRRLFGGLKSAMFVLSVERDGHGAPQTFVFSGGGHGHGVGMCQSGAIGMAERGARYEKILDRYYRGAQIRRVY